MLGVLLGGDLWLYVWLFVFLEKFANLILAIFVPEMGMELAVGCAHCWGRLRAAVLGV